MTSTHPNHLVADYLQRLDAAAAVLPPARRTELVAEIRAHIDDALRDAGAVDEGTVHNILERLGTPEEIVGATTLPITVEPDSRGEMAGGLEMTALLALAVGGFLGFIVPFVGWLAGAGLVIVSRWWSAREKLVGLLALPLLVFVAAMLVSAWRGEAWRGPAEVIVWGVFGLVGPAYLVWRLQHPVPRVALWRVAHIGGMR